MSWEDVRPPACSRCGLVESARATGRHTCNPTSVQAMQLGQRAVEAIGRAIRDAMQIFHPMTPAEIEALLASAIEHDDTGVMIACYVALGREYPRELDRREPEACAYYAWRGREWAMGELRRDAESNRPLQRRKVE